MMDIYFKKLADMYIEETKDICGTKFCGCSKNECNLYDNKTSCRSCLRKNVEERILNDE